jgi:hypothetical protein
MKITLPFSASILIVLAFGIVPSAQAKGSHHSSSHHGEDHYYGHSGPAFRIYTGFGYSPYGTFYGGRGYYGYSGLPYFRASVPTYRPAGSLAVEVQVALARRGYYHGAIDGIIGSGSRRALRNFQGANRLRVTGQIDGPTVSALRYPKANQSR